MGWQTPDKIIELNDLVVAKVPAGRPKDLDDARALWALHGTEAAGGGQIMPHAQAEPAACPPIPDQSQWTGMDFDIIKRLLAAFEREQVRYAIFGAVAMSLHGLARFTEDLDVFVAPEAANIDRLKVALRSVVDDPEIEHITAADLLGEYPAVQYVPPDGTFHIDIVTRLGEAYAFADLPIARVPFDGLHVSVVTPKGLYEMKRNTERLKDRADAEALKERFGMSDDGER